MSLLGFGLHWHGVGLWLGLACSRAVAAVTMALRCASLTSPQPWSKADAPGWRGPTAPCREGWRVWRGEPATARHEATGTPKFVGDANLETTQVYAESRIEMVRERYQRA
jgi:hypothetical protein